MQPLPKKTNTTLANVKNPAACDVLSKLETQSALRTIRQRPHFGGNSFSRASGNFLVATKKKLPMPDLPFVTIYSVLTMQQSVDYCFQKLFHHSLKYFRPSFAVRSVLLPLPRKTLTPSLTKDHIPFSHAVGADKLESNKNVFLKKKRRKKER